MFRLNWLRRVSQSWAEVGSTHPARARLTLSYAALANSTPLVKYYILYSKYYQNACFGWIIITFLFFYVRFMNATWQNWRSEWPARVKLTYTFFEIWNTWLLSSKLLNHFFKNHFVVQGKCKNWCDWREVQRRMPCIPGCLTRPQWRSTFIF